MEKQLTFLAVIGLAIFYGLVTCVAIDIIKSVDADAKSRAQQSLEGLFDYYWKEDPVHKEVKFWFACGAIGELGGVGLDQCSCYSPTVCLNCYRWWTGVSLESVATYGIYTNSTNRSTVADAIFDHSPYNANWNPTNAFIDDFLWYGMTYLRVYEWLKVNLWFVCTQ